MKAKEFQKNVWAFKDYLFKDSERLNEFFTRIPFLFVLLFVTVFFITLAYLLPIHFEENDDVIMLLIASGKITGSPEAHLVFINYLLGFIISKLYSIYGGIEWYTLILAISHFGSLSIIIWHFCKKKIHVFLKIGIIAFFLAFEALLIARFQFTTTAGLVAISAIVLMLNDEKAKKYLGVFMFFLASLIRFEAAFLVLLISSPLFLRFLFPFNKAFIIPVIAVVFSLLGYFGNYLAYQNDTWRYYYEYNKLRGQINDNPNAFDGLEAISDNISEEELRLFMEFIPDGKKWNLAFLKEFKEGIPLKKVNFKKNLSLEAFENLVNDHKKRMILISGLFLLSLLIIVNGQKRFAILIGFSFFWIILAALSMNHTVKLRIINLATLALLLLVAENFESKIFKFNWFKLFSSVFLLLLAALAMKETALYKNDNKNSRFVFGIQMEAIKCTEGKVFPLPKIFYLNGIDPFDVSEKWQEDKIILAGWLTNYPSEKNVLRSYRDFLNGTIIFYRNDQIEKVIPDIQKAIFFNYKTETEIIKEMQGQEYSLIRIKDIYDLP